MGGRKLSEWPKKLKDFFRFLGHLTAKFPTHYGIRLMVHEYVLKDDEFLTPGVQLQPTIEG